jgi:hypothetical protein
MGRHLWLLVSGCAWAVMMYFLFDHEIKPFFEYQQAPTYQMIFRDRKQAEHQRRAVFFVDKRIGDAESLSEPVDGGGYRMRSRMLMHMKPFGGIQLPDDRAYMTSEFRLDSAYLLADFRLNGNLQGIPVSARGERQGDKLLLSYNLVILKKDGLLIPFPRDATLSDNFLPYQGGGRLTEGKKWKMKLFDLGNLVSMNKDHQVDMTELYAAVVGQEKPPSRGEDKMAWHIVVRRAPREEEPWMYLLWVDDDGTVLEQHMKINSLICRIVMESRRSLTADELKSFEWGVQAPK